MAKAILIYGSTMGNTETLSEGVVSGLKKGSMEVTVKNVTEASIDELSDYDIIVLGCSTWGDGELQDDFIDFYEKMNKVKLDGRKAACFGTGDSAYPQFCKAVDMLEEKLKECGTEILLESFKVDGDIESKTSDAKNWGLKIARAL